MAKYYVILDADGVMLQWNSSPQKNKEYLIITTENHFTMFTTESVALDKIQRSKEYLETQANKEELARFWNIDEWKVVEFMPND